MEDKSAGGGAVRLQASTTISGQYNRWGGKPFDGGLKDNFDEYGDKKQEEPKQKS